MCLAQGPQRSDAGEASTHCPSVLSQALYHWATALPVSVAFTDNVFYAQNVVFITEYYLMVYIYLLGKLNQRRRIQLATLHQKTTKSKSCPVLHRPRQIGQVEPRHRFRWGYKWAATWDFQQSFLQCGVYATSLIRAFASRLNILWILSYWLNIKWEFLCLKGGYKG